MVFFFLFTIFLFGYLKLVTGIVLIYMHVLLLFLQAVTYSMLKGGGTQREIRVDLSLLS